MSVTSLNGRQQRVLHTSVVLEKAMKDIQHVYVCLYSSYKAPELLKFSEKRCAVNELHSFNAFPHNTAHSHCLLAIATVRTVGTVAVCGE